ncbi:ABC transporter permease [Prosthecobacter sp.]
MPIPSPILPLARLEARLIWRRRASWLLLGLFTVLMLIAGLLSGLRQAREREQQTAYQKLVRQQWEAQPDRHPHRAAHYGTFAFKPRSLLAAYEPGIEAYAGRIQFLEAHRQNGSNFAEASTLSSASRLGELSPAFLVECVLALVIIVLGHGVFAAEVETGRDRLLRAQIGQRRGLWAGKTLGLWLGISPFVLIAALVPLTLLFFGESGLADRAGVLVAALLLYSVLWVLLVAAVSSVCRSSQAALAVLICLWLGGGVLLPRAAAGFAAAAHPLPDKSEFNARLGEEIAKLGDSHNDKDPAFIALKEETLRKHGVSRVEDLPFNYKGQLMAAGEEQSAKVFAQEYAKIEAVLDQQTALVRRLAWLSPSLALRDLAMRLCGTDAASQQRFIREAEAYRFSFIQHLNHLQRDHTNYAEKNVERIDEHFFDEVEDFKPTPHTLSPALAGSTTSWAVLGLWIAVAALFGRRFA